MKIENTKLANIVVSLTFAIAMILSAYFISDNEVANVVSLLLISGWLVPLFYLSKKSNCKSTQ